VRTALSALAIGVQVTMILTLVGLSRGTLDDMQRRARGVNADIVVRPPGSSVIGLSSAPMSEKLVAFVESQPHVALATGVAVFGIGGVNTVTGIDLDKFNRMSGGFKYLSGGPFRGPDDVIVDEYYARQNGLKTGDPVQFMNRTWRVCGVVEPGKMARIFIALPRLQEFSSNTGKISMIYVKADDPANIPSVHAHLKSQLKEYPIFTMEELISQITVTNLHGLQTFTYVVIGISVIVGFLVVFLSMYTAVLERTREIGILKSLGATPLFVLGILVRETLFLALIGSVIGILFTYGTRWTIMTYVPGSLIQVIVPDWWPISAMVAILGALMGALYPGWKAARQDAIEALAYE